MEPLREALDQSSSLRYSSSTGECQNINGEKYPAIKIEILPPSSESPDAFVFLGDGNCSFSTAFALRRGSWQGVVPTDKEDEKDLKIDRDSQLKSVSEEHPELQGEVDELKKLTPSWKQLDATEMGDRMGFRTKLGILGDPAITLWFQGPWDFGPQNDFLKDVITNAAAIQVAGEYLIIGITTDKYWVPCYGSLTTASSRLYDCIGADATFVGQMLERGYAHRFHHGGESGLKQFASLLLQRTRFPPGVLVHFPGCRGLFYYVDGQRYILHGSFCYQEKFTAENKRANFDGYYLDQEQWLKITNKTVTGNIVLFSADGKRSEFYFWLHPEYELKIRRDDGQLQ